MSTMLTPTRIFLVGTAFLLIYLCISMGMALPSSSNDLESLNKMKDFHNNFINNEIYDNQGSNMGELKLTGDTILFPWASKHVSGLNSDTGFRSNCPQKEKIAISGPQPTEIVQDLKAINSVKQRDIIYDGNQTGNLSNRMDVRVLGSPRREELHYSSRDAPDNNDPETLVDNALSSGGNNRNEKRALGNYMNIDVSGITVSAINTVEGGSAVATSNIIIKPVQIIDGSSQAMDKVY